MTVSFPPGRDDPIWQDAPIVCEAIFLGFNTDPYVEDKNTSSLQSHSSSLKYFFTPYDHHREAQPLII